MRTSSCGSNGKANRWRNKRCASIHDSIFFVCCKKKNLRLEPKKNIWQGYKTHYTMWKKQLRAVIEPFLLHDVIPVVVSPDMDGIVSTLILHQYVQQFKKRVKIIGTYNSKTVMATTSFDEAKRALWVDIDCRFTGVAHIGQHLLGDVTLNPHSFNPNHCFQEHTIYNKYPWGTAQLMLWGLFEKETDAFPIFREKFGLAKAAFLHCDSTYNNCIQYATNSKHWADVLFHDDGAPLSLKDVLNGSYHTNALKVHCHMLKMVGPHVKGGGKRRTMGWQQCTKQQTVTAIPPLLQVLANMFRCNAPDCALDGAAPVFAGRLERWSTDNVHQVEIHPEVVSHAIINRKTISVTLQ